MPILACFDICSLLKRCFLRLEYAMFCIRGNYKADVIGTVACGGAAKWSTERLVYFSEVNYVKYKTISSLKLLNISSSFHIRLTH